MTSPSIRLDLGDVGDPAGAVPEAGLVHDQVDRGGHLLADRAHGQVHAGHQHHRLEASSVSRGLLAWTVQIEPS